jgi:glycosyltransferase involved in cell wall biosynthesis
MSYNNICLDNNCKTQLQLHYVNTFLPSDIISCIYSGPHAICRSETVLSDEIYTYISDYIASPFFCSDITFIFQSNGYSDKEPIIVFFESSINVQRSMEDIMKGKIHVVDKVFGINASKLTFDQIHAMYYFFGTFDIPLKYFGFNDAHDEYMKFIVTNNALGRMFNKYKLERCYCVFCGQQNISYKDTIDSVHIFLNNRAAHFPTKSVLIVGKQIVGYGGNQKTSRQLIDLLDRYYNVHILSGAINSNKKQANELLSNLLCSTIFNGYIIRYTNEDDIINHIHSQTYEFIINNKLNEFFNIVPNLKDQKIYVITHNSMDPFNRLIIENSEYLSKVFTINNRHKQLLEINKILCPVDIFTNYIDKNNNYTHINQRYRYKRVITFIGRLSKEKNVHLLIDAFKELKAYGMELTLNIVGDCKVSERNKYIVDDENIKYYGQLSYESIKQVLYNTDFLIQPSYTEGIPFSIIESMSMGIPCIYSNINGSEDIITHSKTGFLFNLNGYDIVKDVIDSWSVYKQVDKYHNINVENLKQCVIYAYSKGITEWKKMSHQCRNYIESTFTKSTVIKRNINKL